MSTVTPKSTPEQAQNGSPKIEISKYACNLCQQRKVKCDRVLPTCASCIKSKAECIYRDPDPPKRRKRKHFEEEVQPLLAQLRQYEELLKGAGIQPPKPPEIEQNSELAPTETPDSGSLHTDWKHQLLQASNGVALKKFGADVEARGNFQGKILLEGGRSRYLENSLWTNLNEEVRSMPLADNEDEAQGDNPDESVGSDIILGLPTEKSLHDLHPEPHQVQHLWQIFYNNVNPLTKILHTPTTREIIIEASQHLHDLPKSLEALLFAIYSTAVHSLDDGDCHQFFRAPKAELLKKYIAGARQSLINARLLKSSEMMVLQAFVLFLLSVRQAYDSRSLWILSGVATRIAQRMGLQRDGIGLGVPIFETEMRRRLWWQIMVLEGRMAELSGSIFPFAANFSDTKLPLNINDNQIQPGMTTAPTELEGATEMMFCNLRYTIGDFFRSVQDKAPGKGFNGIWHWQTGPANTDAKDKMIDELEGIFEKKFMRFCDPLDRLHMMTALVARSALAISRFKVHHPRNQNRKMEQDEIDKLFSNCLKIIEYDNMGHSTKNVRGFLWHISVFFAWDAFIFILTELRRRTTGDQADRAWAQVEQAYEHHPEFLENSSAFHRAIGTLAERAWKEREAALAARSQNGPFVVLGNWRPKFISEIRARQAKHHAPHSAAETPAHGQMWPPVSGMQQNSTDPLLSFDADQSPIDWAAWDGMIEDFDLTGFGTEQFA